MNCIWCKSSKSVNNKVEHTTGQLDRQLDRCTLSNNWTDALCPVVISFIVACAVLSIVALHLNHSGSYMDCIWSKSSKVFVNNKVEHTSHLWSPLEDIGWRTWLPLPCGFGVRLGVRLFCSYIIYNITFKKRNLKCIIHLKHSTLIS